MRGGAQVLNPCALGQAPTVLMLSLRLSCLVPDELEIASRIADERIFWLNVARNCLQRLPLTP
jgi:hypothetical protein